MTLQWSQNQIQNFENPVPGKHPFLFTRQNVRNETEESDPTKTPELMLVRSLELWVVLENLTKSYTPSGGTLQLGIFSAPLLPAARAERTGEWVIWFREMTEGVRKTNGGVPRSGTPHLVDLG